jgi:hypothetical protein
MGQHDNEIPGLLRLDAIDAFKLAAQKSGKGVGEIAKEMGWDGGQARRIFSVDRYYPSYEQLPILCGVLGNTIIIQWLQVQAMHAGMATVPQDINCAKLIQQIGKLFGEVSDVGKEAQCAIEDGKLEPKEVRRIIRELNDVLDHGADMLGTLRAWERDNIGRASE